MTNPRAPQLIDNPFEDPEIGDYVKVQLPRERPWVVCIAVHDDGSITGRIDNDLVFSEHTPETYRRAAAEKFFGKGAKPLPPLHRFKLGDLVTFQLRPYGDDLADLRWQPVELN